MSATGRSPGRVCIIGEHADWMGGEVLVCATPNLHTIVEVESITGESDEAFFPAFYPHRTKIGVGISRGDQARIEHALNLLDGVLRALEHDFGPLPTVRFTIRSEIPLSGGLSSSASLCVASVRAYLTLLGRKASDMQVAEIAFRAEHDFASIPCGRMDQYAVATGGFCHINFGPGITGHRSLPWPSGIQMVVAASASAARFTDQARTLARRWDEMDRELIVYLGHCGDAISVVVRELDRSETFTAAALSAINECHRLGDRILRVGNSEIDELIETAKSAGALCAKSTGMRSHGGSMFALATAENMNRVCSALKSTGALPIIIDSPYYHASTQPVLS